MVLIATVVLILLSVAVKCVMFCDDIISTVVAFAARFALVLARGLTLLMTVVLTLTST